MVEKGRWIIGVMEVGEGQIWIWIEMGKAVHGSREDRTEGE